MWRGKSILLFEFSAADHFQYPDMKFKTNWGSSTFFAHIIDMRRRMRVARGSNLLKLKDTFHKKISSQIKKSIVKPTCDIISTLAGVIYDGSTERVESFCLAHRWSINNAEVSNNTSWTHVGHFNTFNCRIEVQ